MNDDLTLVRRFALAITTLETEGDVEPVVALYAEHSVSGNSLRPDAFEGLDGARRFWQQYRDQFSTVHSTFRRIIEADGSGVLEWDSVGEVLGRTLSYRGVTVLDVDGPLITRSCAYFDSAALTAHIDHDDPDDEAHRDDPAVGVTDGEDG